MIWIRLIAAFALPLLTGCAFVFWALRRDQEKDVIEGLVLGLAVGFGFMSALAFAVNLLGLPLSVLTLGVAQALVLLVFALLYIKSRAAQQERGALRPPPMKGPGSIKVIACYALGAIIILKFAFVLYEGLNRPIFSHDTWKHWSVGAKFFFYNRSLILDSSSEYFLGQGYREFLGYPLHNPLMQTWIALVLGSFHEILVKSWSAVIFISMAGLIFTAVRREAGLLMAILAAFFLATVPLLTYHGMDAYADIVVAFYVLCGSLLLWRYFEGGGVLNTMLSGLLFAIAVYTKSEGIIYIFSAALALVAYNIFEKRREFRSIVYFIAPAVLYLLPWLVFKSYHGLGFGHGSGTGVEAGDSAGGILFTSSLHYEVIPIFLKELLLTINHGLIFPFLLLFTVLGFATVMKTNLKYLYIILLVSMGGFLFIYTATADFRYVLNGVATSRNILTFVPLSYLIGSILAVRLLKREKNGNASHE